MAAMDMLPIWLRQKGIMFERTGHRNRRSEPLEQMLGKWLLVGAVFEKHNAAQAEYNRSAALVSHRGP
jgi:hypothetical protein